MSLHRFLVRLIFLCMMPLILLAVFLSVSNVLDKQADRDTEASNLAKNLSTAIDERIRARIIALQMLAESPLADDASLWKELYRKLQDFHEGFESHVIFADPQMRMRFNTRVPFDSALPLTPLPYGHAAAQTVLATGKPAIGDRFFGPIAGEPLVDISVPVMHEGKVAYLLLAIFETRHFQQRIEQVSLPSGWSLSLIDGKQEVIARRAPPGLNATTDVDASGRFVVKSSLTPWSVVLEIPRYIYLRPLFEAAATLFVAIMAIALLSLLGGLLVSRRLEKSVASLAKVPAPEAPPPEIAEIASVRRLLDEADRERKLSEIELRESEQKHRLVVNNMADVIIVLDMDLRFTYVSSSIERLLGFTAEEAMALSLDRIMTPESMEIIARLFEKEMNKEESGTANPFRNQVLELQECRKDGTLVWIENTLSYIRDDNLKPLGFISVSRDITERKEAQNRLQQTLEHLRMTMDAVIQVLVSAVEMRDPYTAGHQRRVADLAGVIADEMGLSADRSEGIRVAGAIHDVGKIAVPAEILSKPKRLTEIEFGLIRTHCRAGYDILKDIDFPWPVARVVHEHHERMDGSGYPNGRRAENILLESRILTVADVVEAMASHRPYRPALELQAALGEIEAKKGTLYDADVVDACLRLFREKAYTLPMP